MGKKHSFATSCVANASKKTYLQQKKPKYNLAKHANKKSKNSYFLKVLPFQIKLPKSE